MPCCHSAPSVVYSYCINAPPPMTIATATRQTRADIPATWQLKGVLARHCGLRQPERFAFYDMPDGRVAEVMFHPMNGADDLFFRIDTAAGQRNRWNELLEGEVHREGRYAKAQRVA